ncbi:uncharacterized protein LOC134207384 [Armigeres subalbatus]|uniref:uncharacterized protein LOC134207384 n=1 Tax=Armigeres subalbatus TaxID=124917 RepID=UPI002ED11390
MVTKAVHLELVSDLSTDAFIAALKRFVARRGKPVALFCDNATNFKGADRQLRELCSQLNHQQHHQKVVSFCAESAIQFSFIPANAPTFGGLWEAAFKSMKNHFRRVVGLDALPSEAMHTVLGQIESCLNSRPLTAVSEDPSDMDVRLCSRYPSPTCPESPVIGFRSGRIFNVDPKEILVYRLPSPASATIQAFLPTAERSSRWSVGRIAALHPGEDVLVRVVKVRLPTGAVFDRPIVKVCILPIDDDPRFAFTIGEVSGIHAGETDPATNLRS